MSLWLISILTILLVFASIHGGYWLYKYRKTLSAGSVIEPSSTAIAAMMGLLAFMLAFAFSMGANRLEVRKTLMLDEMNAIGTLHLRADILSPDEGTEMKKLLVEYTKLRIDLAKDANLLQGALIRSNEINDALWGIVINFRKAYPEDKGIIPLMGATNAVIDIYGARVFVGSQHIPVIIWAVLVAMTILAMFAIGYQMGVEHRMSNLLAIIVTLTFSAVLFLIADLDRYDQGFFVLPDQPMIDFYESIAE
jgi:hypothetical protein